jgi:plasmid maintenance system antidote protein VapI
MEIRFGFCPTHPGEVLKEEIAYRKISQKELAKQMGMSYNVSEIRKMAGSLL